MINMDVTNTMMHRMWLKKKEVNDRLRDPITTRHVGTIAFQGTDAQIKRDVIRYFGVDAKAGS